MMRRAHQTSFTTLAGAIVVCGLVLPQRVAARPPATAASAATAAAQVTTASLVAPAAKAPPSKPATPAPAASKPPSTGAPAPAKAPAPTSPTATTEPAATPGAAAPADAGSGDEEITRYTFTGLDIDGELRTPALLQFLARIGGEFETVGIPHRSFMPELASTIAEDSL